MEGSGKALACALRALARRDHSEAELRRKLRDKGFPAGGVDGAIDRLKVLGYLDDRRFAGRWADSAIRNGRAFGPRLRMELLRRGVAESVVADVLAELTGEHGEPETVAALLTRKFAGFDPKCADDREKRRVIGYLQRRGFSIAAILKVFREQ